MQYFLSSTFNICRCTNTRISATDRAIRCSNPCRGKRFSSAIFFQTGYEAQRAIRCSNPSRGKRFSSAIFFQTCCEAYRAIRCSILSRGKRFSSAIFFFRPATLPTNPSIHFVPGFFLAGNGRGVMLTTHLRLEERLRMSGCVLVRPQYTLIV